MTGTASGAGGDGIDSHYRSQLSIDGHPGSSAGESAIPAAAAVLSTSHSAAPSAMVPDRDDLPPLLLIGIESAVDEPDPQARARVICSLVEEIYQTLAWLHSAEQEEAELTSLAQVVGAARDHVARMVDSHPSASDVRQQ